MTTRRGFFAALAGGAVATATLKRAPSKSLSVEEFTERYLAPPAEAVAERIDEQILQVGDVITISGYNAVNPITREDTGMLQVFTVVADYRLSDPHCPIALIPLRPLPWQSANA